MKIRMCCQALAFSVISATLFAQTAPRKATPKPSNAPIDIIIGEDDAAAQPPRSTPAATPVSADPSNDAATRAQKREELKSAIDQRKSSSNPTDRALGKMMEDFFKDVDSEFQGAAELNREIGSVQLADLDTQSKLRAYHSRLKDGAQKLGNAEQKIRKFQDELKHTMEAAGVRGEELATAEAKIKQSTTAMMTKIQVMASYPDAIAILDEHWGQWKIDPKNSGMPVFEKEVPETEVAKFKSIVSAVHQLSATPASN